MKMILPTVIAVRAIVTSALISLMKMLTHFVGAVRLSLAKCTGRPLVVCQADTLRLDAYPADPPDG